VQTALVFRAELQAIGHAPRRRGIQYTPHMQISAAGVYWIIRFRG